jgi:LAS superfamily LD-carboxypeptidase LdcB
MLSRRPFITKSKLESAHLKQEAVPVEMRLNQTVAFQSTKSQTMLFSNEIDESRVEQTKIARRRFVENEKKMLLD